jgi:hypothetical protein
MNNILLVYSSPRSKECEEEYNAFFDFFYTQCMLSVPGLVAATRYRLSNQQMEWILPASREPRWPFGLEHTYLTVYETDPAVAASEIFDGMRESPAAKTVRNPDEVPVVWGPQWFYEPITKRETSARLKPKEDDETAKPTHIWVVPNSPLSEDVELANNYWYTTQSNLQYPGFLSVTRYRLGPVQRPRNGGETAWPHGRHTQLALWELNDLSTAAQHRRRAYHAGASFPSYSWIPPIGELRKADDHVIYEALTNRVRPIFL